jgi:hypothetical protein
MDVWIIPKASDLHAVTAQHINALVGAGGTANMQQGFHKASLQNGHIITF